MPSVASLLFGPSASASVSPAVVPAEPPPLPPEPLLLVPVALLDPPALDEPPLNVPPAPGFGASLSPEQAAESTIRTRAPADSRSKGVRMGSSARRRMSPMVGGDRERPGSTNPWVCRAARSERIPEPPQPDRRDGHLVRVALAGRGAPDDGAPWLAPLINDARRRGRRVAVVIARALGSTWRVLSRRSRNLRERATLSGEGVRNGADLCGGLRRQSVSGCRRQSVVHGAGHRGPLSGQVRARRPVRATVARRFVYLPNAFCPNSCVLGGRSQIGATYDRSERRAIASISPGASSSDAHARSWRMCTGSDVPVSGSMPTARANRKTTCGTVPPTRLAIAAMTEPPSSRRLAVSSEKP